MKKPGLLLLIVVGLVIAWHTILYIPMDRERCIDQVPSGTCQLLLTIRVNPLTDVAVITAPPAAAFGITDPTVAAGFQWGFAFAGAPTAESQLNLYARQYFDLYAMLLPYRVSIVKGDLAGGRPAPIANEPAKYNGPADYKPAPKSIEQVLGLGKGRSPESDQLGEVELALREDENSYLTNDCQRPRLPFNCRRTFLEALEYKPISLSPSGQQGLIVELSLCPPFCGSGGYSVYVLRAHATSFPPVREYGTILETVGNLQSLFVAETTTNGYYDLVENGGTVANPKQFKYVWDGSKYQLLTTTPL